MRTTVVADDEISAGCHQAVDYSRPEADLVDAGEAEPRRTLLMRLAGFSTPRGDHPSTGGRSVVVRPDRIGTFSIAQPRS